LVERVRVTSLDEGLIFSSPPKGTRLAADMLPLQASVRMLRQLSDSDTADPDEREQRALHAHR
jgi:hypothetical protein